MNEASITPDFIQIPYEVVKHPGLRPTDLTVYGVLYWYEHMKEGVCRASNPTIASVARCTVRAVQGALSRLEKVGFIQVVFLDKQKKTRVEIKTLVRYARTEAKQRSIIEERLPEMSFPDEPTPGEIARKFFDNGDTSMRLEIHKQLCDANPNINAEQLKGEMKKFIVYWTEPNKSGTKQKWQLQQTFDIKRRLYTWLSRAGQRGRTAAGAGRSI